MNLIEITNLSASYNGHLAIDKVSINIKEKEFICLVGENGSGKSTIIKTILGLHKQDKGKIKMKIEAKEISYLEQFNMREIDFPGTAKEIIMTGRQKKGSRLFYTKEDTEAFNEICKKLGIQDIVNKKIGELSGGQRQRVMLARAMISKPKLIILDEPCSGLDKKISDKLYDMLLDINKEYGTTVIMSIHNAYELAQRNEKKNVDIRVIHIAKSIKYDGNLSDWKGL